MTETCGCPDRTDHVTPTICDVLELRHCERSALNNDPLPHHVPGTGGWNGLYNASPDAYCLCGHPNYLTCQRLDGGSIEDMVFIGTPGDRGIAR